MLTGYTRDRHSHLLHSRQKHTIVRTETNCLAGCLSSLTHQQKLGQKLTYRPSTATLITYCWERKTVMFDTYLHWLASVVSRVGVLASAVIATSLNPPCLTLHVHPVRSVRVHEHTAVCQHRHRYSLHVPRTLSSGHTPTSKTRTRTALHTVSMDEIIHTYRQGHHFTKAQTCKAMGRNRTTQRHRHWPISQRYGHGHIRQTWTQTFFYTRLWAWTPLYRH